MGVKNFLDVVDVIEWHKWLETNHNKEREIWLIFYKKQSGSLLSQSHNLSYEESIEEALCFGWIDSVVMKIDDIKYARKFTPRINSFKWSDSNINRVRKLINEGRMREAGLSTIPVDILDDKFKTVVKTGETEEIPGFIMESLEKNKEAGIFFKSLAPSYRKLYIKWIMSAKRQETRERRLFEAVELLSRGEKLGLK